MKKFCVLLAALMIFAAGLSGTALALSVTSSIVPDNMSVEGVPIIYRDVGETVTFTLTAHDAVGDVTWNLTQLVDGSVSDTNDFQLSDTTGSVVTVTGTVKSQTGYSLGVLLMDENYDTGVAQYSLWIQPSANAGQTTPGTPGDGAGSGSDPVPVPDGDSESGSDSASNKALPWGVVEVVEPEEVSANQIEQIAAALNADAGSVKFIVSSDITHAAPAEPTKAMRDFAAKNKYTFAAKLDTITVKEDGVYIFKVVIPKELKGVKPEKLELFGIDPAAIANNYNPDESSGDVEASVLPPVFAGLGSAIDWAAIFGDDYWVVGAILPAAQPLSMYLLKLLVMLLAGCDAGAGVGLGVFGLIAVCGSFAAFKIFRRK